MARKSSRRVNSRAEQQERYEVWGNTVRKAEAIPEERPRRKSGVSRRAQRNRARAVQMSRGYVVFLAVVSVPALLMCVRYLKLKAEITTQTSEIASLESALNELKADNDALYNTVTASVDLEQIRKEAMDRLGMDYPNEDQIYQFDTSGNSYVRQYKDVPDAE